MLIVFEKEIEWVVGAFKLVVIAAVLIYAAYLIIQSLLPGVPAYIGAVLVGILGIFVYAVRDKIKDSIGSK